jgi:hypothetical protein
MRSAAKWNGARALASLSLLVLLVLPIGGCAGRGARPWGEGADFVGFDPQTLNRGGPADFSILVPLSEIFYQRMVDRRFNSKATYDDPGLREFFRSAESFSDYYAALAEALELTYFESHRPRVINLLGMKREGLNAVRVRVYMRGRNRLPLRFWATSVVREDRWEYAQGRWWVIPGKV